MINETFLKLGVDSRAKMRRVAVIGGGISGLGAAYELAKAGVNVVLYEKEDYGWPCKKLLMWMASISILVSWSSIGYVIS